MIPNKDGLLSGVSTRCAPDWSQNPQPALESEVFVSSASSDAFSRPIQMVAPHRNQANVKINVIQPGYNEANLLEEVDAWLGQTAERAPCSTGRRAICMRSLTSTTTPGTSAPASTTATAR